MTWLLAILSNSWVQRIGIYGLAIGAVFMSGFFYKGSCTAKKEFKQEVKYVTEVLEKTRIVHDRYRDTKFTDDSVLSGQASEHSKACIPSDGVR